MVVLALAATLAAGPALAQRPDPPTDHPPTWLEVKCARYRQAWTGILARSGKGRFGPEFLASQEAFIASGCTNQGHVCPHSPEELEVADILTVLSMNAGTASTFLPFACPR